MSDSGTNPIRVVLLGPPASGKGTQGRRVAEAFDLSYLSTGALLREHVENRTPLGWKAKPILDRGEYLPDGLMCDVIAEWLESQSDGWVLDGFPRSLPQAEFLHRWLDNDGGSGHKALFLDVPFSELLDRIKSRVECPDCRWSGQRSQLDHDGRCPKCGGPASGRDDDDEGNFRSRYRQFEEITLPAVDYYRKQGGLVAVDATRAKDDVASEIIAAIR